jgi:tetratricopeptide (TPR) repeat protein
LPYLPTTLFFDVDLAQVTTYYDIPPIRAPHFVARNALLAQLESLFEQSTTTTSRFIVVLIGMGGVGKTQLTLEFCIRMKDLGNFRGIFWLDGSSRNSLCRSMEIIAKWLLPGRVFDNPDDAVNSVKDVLSKWSNGWLMVIDNFDNPSELRDILFFLPDSRWGFIIITSRHAGSKELGQVVEVDCMEKAEGLQLFFPCSEGEPDEVAAAEEILTRLEYLPLVIDQARAYISRRQLRLRDFVCELEARKRNIMKETQRFWHYYRTLPDNRRVSLNMLTTWEMSLALLGVGEDTRVLRDVLSLLSFFHPVSISENLFRSDVENRIRANSPMSIFDDNGHWNHLKFEDAVLQMQDLSLLRFSYRGPNEIVVSLHSMVSEWLRMRLDEDSRPTLFSSAVSHLEHYLGSTEHNDHTTRQETLSHIDTICQAEEFRMKSSSFVGACSTFGVFYSHQGHLNDAEKMFNRALSGKEETLGPEHMSTLETLINLGNVYTDQGRLDDAEWVYIRALSGCENALGPEHMFALGTVNNLGLLYADQGRLADAEGMYKRALAGFEEALGPGHRSTLDTVNNLGLLYARQGRLDDAERMYDRALAGKEEALGHEHTSTLDTVYNFGNLYKSQSRFEDAERMYNRALVGYEAVWGPEHMSTLKTVNNLAFLYAKQGFLEDAERMYNRALVGKEKALGLGHESTLKTVRNLRNLYKARERRDEAERIHEYI